MDRRKFITIAARALAFSIMPIASSKKLEKKDVILCFDGGSADYVKMEKALDFADELSYLTNEPSNFTFFLTSCFYFPHLNGKSNVGWGGNQRDIDTRLAITQKAIDLGHEIGGHTVRHLHGGKWSYQQWFDELREFDEHIAGFFVDKQGKPYKPVGFRAPYLEWNNNMFRALLDLGYIYDISSVGDGIKKRNGIVSVGVPMLRRDNGGTVLGIDYNWMVSGVTNSELERILHKESAERNPLVISLHLADYRHKSEYQSYYKVVKDFMQQGAKEGRFRFPSMIEYVRGIQDLL